ncbi:hypothetical protein HT102_01375 [Hoyosella sp. G463]|uniref:Uncharacterized protein n=1 Tax=Lolliginicoccus lacisalsi TaxID=2742202 RepID=A0A927J9T7_9ACTN|nr:hypothetical protein [Lolliginicoccus lacisalsi]MBD8505141.1 hypothetical protein [Lolliginicoccus lacisalsi]
MTERGTDQSSSTNAPANPPKGIIAGKNIAYILIALAIIAVPGALAAAAGGMTGVAIALGVIAVLLLLVGIVLWRRSAVVLSEALPDTNDRQRSSEGRGPLGD